MNSLIINTQVGEYFSFNVFEMFFSFVCSQVDVFGFGADSNRNWSHYFEVLKNKKYGTGPHSGTNEYRVLKQLANEKTVKLYKGSWSLSDFEMSWNIFLNQKSIQKAKPVIFLQTNNPERLKKEIINKPCKA